MHLPRDPFALRFDGQVAKPILQPRVLDGDRGLVRERRERLDVVHVERPLGAGSDRQQTDRLSSPLERCDEPGHRKLGREVSSEVVIARRRQAAASIDRARRIARCGVVEATLAVGEEQHRRVDADQCPRVPDDRVEDLGQVDERGDRDTDPPQRRGRGRAFLELAIADGQRRPKQIDPSVRGPGQGGRQDEDDEGHEDRVARKREGRVENGVADDLDPAHDERRDDDDQQPLS